jgi:hypothetical protein
MDSLYILARRLLPLLGKLLNGLDFISLDKYRKALVY